MTVGASQEVIPVFGEVSLGRRYGSDDGWVGAVLHDRDATA